MDNLTSQIRSGIYRGKYPDEIEKRCLNCERRIPKYGISWSQYSKRKFCGDVCQRKFMLGERNPKWGGRDPVNCLKCGAEIEFPINYPPSNRKARKYCGNKRCKYFPKSDGGYPKVFDPERKRFVFEHRLLAEKALGRKLRKDEDVHHVNGRRDDNRPKNLLICDSSYHHWLHNRMAQLYMLEHFD